MEEKKNETSGTASIAFLKIRKRLKRQFKAAKKDFHANKGDKDIKRAYKAAKEAWVRVRDWKDEDGEFFEQKTNEERKQQKRKRVEDAGAERSTSGASSEANKIDSPISKKKKHADGEDSGASQSKEGEKPKVPSGKYEAFTLFVGQLPYTCTKEEIKAHFRDGGAGEVSVRMLHDKKTKKFRGIAFVDFKTSRQMSLGLRLHQSHFGEFAPEPDAASAPEGDNAVPKRRRHKRRIINVERTCGGGGRGSKRMEKLSKLRDVQGQQVMKEVLREIDDAIEETGGRIQREDFDQNVLDALCTVPRTIAKELLIEFGNSLSPKVRNRSAWLMGILKKYRTQLMSGETIDLSFRKGEGRGRGRGRRGRGSSRGRGRGRGRGG